MADEKPDVVEQLASRQPTRKGTERELRRFDRTQLKFSTQGKQIHRDYAAHFFRWGWATRHMGNGDRVLDVGCGQDLPLLNVLSRFGSELPDLYLGVELNRLPLKASRSWAQYRDEFNFIDDYARIVADFPEKFTVGVSFEVIEHMQPTDGEKMLLAFRQCLTPEGRLYLSTPIFDGKAAANHIHEYTVPELQALVEGCGFITERRFGTFANWQAIKKVCLPAELEVMKKLSEYYSSEVLSTFLAPLYPDASRNNLWILRSKKGK